MRPSDGSTSVVVDAGGPRTTERQSRTSLPTRAGFAWLDSDPARIVAFRRAAVDPGHALREASRALKPGGRIFVTLPNAVNLRFRLAILGGGLSKDFLHQNDGEGLHIRFFNYAGDFERLVAQQAPSLRLVEKVPALKNPRKHGSVVRRVLDGAVRAWPNLFAEYSHFTLEVVRP